VRLDHDSPAPSTSRHTEDSKFLCKPGHLWRSDDCYVTVTEQIARNPVVLSFSTMGHRKRPQQVGRSCPQFSATTAAASKLANYPCFRGAPRVPTVDPGRTSPWWLRIIFSFFVFWGLSRFIASSTTSTARDGEERLLRCRRQMGSYLHPKTLLCLVDVLSSGAFWRLTQTKSKATTWKCCIFPSLIQRSRIP